MATPGPDRSGNGLGVPVTSMATCVTVPVVSAKLGRVSAKKHSNNVREQIFLAIFVRVFAQMCKLGPLSTFGCAQHVA